MRHNLRNIRIKKGYKDVEKLARKIGISASYYYKIEQGKRAPGINLAKRIADILEHTVDELFFNRNLDESSNERRAI
ncbi:helix-turn-helix transcriptional regulator [Gracilibacillus oryzae]|uniref:Helix-turn-helix transcriptional regulator n=1 Tax=Gracilibacillus oryzae TaxID=1672701 RepID=A0A7C8KWM6_9BACI|nr:helix-turn-helix transcriptional regulator [Gracilibacillus oryzae]KAB8139071.1 helix-turn-helix transcriptional regulator [Gracilibacillus oryzae]